MSKKIAVIGAGISGLLAACMNAEKGYQVTIFEKQDFPPVNPSTIAGGMMAPYSEIDTLPLNFVNAGVKGIDMWKAMLDDGADFVFSKEGSLFVAHPADEVYLDRFVHHLHSVSGSWQWVNEKEICALEPDLRSRFSKGIYIPEEAHLVPLLALEALFKKFISLNGEMIRQEAQPDELMLDYDWVIDCRGYAPQFDQNLRGIKGEILLIRNLEFSLTRPVRLMHPRYPLYIVPRPDHVFAVGATAIENADEDDGLVMLRSAMELMSACYSLHPSFGESKVLDMSSGIRAAYQDNLPRIIIDGEKRYIRSNGLFRHGYLLSPIMARCIAHYIETGEENEDFLLFSGRLNSPVMFA